MEWSHDFCLSCDRQISQSDHGAYCSQSCRLADLERASSSSSIPPSPSTGCSWSPHSVHGPGLYLPPPLNFSSYTNRQQTSSTSSSTTRSSVSASLQHPTRSFSNERTSQLYTSPSRSSLSSLQTCAQQPETTTFSSKIKNELRDYAGSFDHTRDWKRRMTVY